MYTTLLLLSASLHSRAFTDDSANLPQSPPAKAVGALHVLFYPRITHGLMGDPHAGDSRSARAIDGGNGDCIIWTINRFDERHPLLSVAGQSIRHPESDSRHHVLRGGRHAGAQRRAMVYLGGTVCYRLSHLRRQLWLRGSGH